jgi:hypothetical protein
MSDLFDLIESEITANIFGPDTLIFATQEATSKAIKIAESSRIWTSLNHKDKTGYYVSTNNKKSLTSWAAKLDEANVRYGTLKNPTNHLVYEATLKTNDVSTVNAVASKFFVETTTKGNYVKVSGQKGELTKFEKALKETSTKYRIVETVSYKPLNESEDITPEEMAQLEKVNPALAKKVAAKCASKGNITKDPKSGKNVIRDDINEATDENNINRPRAEVGQYGTYEGGDIVVDFDVDMEIQGEKSVEKQTHDEKQSPIWDEEISPTKEAPEDFFDAMLGVDNPKLTLTSPATKIDTSDITIGSGDVKADPVDPGPAPKSLPSGDNMASQPASEPEAKEDPESFKPKKNTDGSDFDGVTKARKDGENGVEKEKDESDVEEPEDDEVEEETPEEAKKKVQEAMIAKLQAEISEKARIVKEQKKIAVVAEGVSNRNWGKMTKVELKNEKADLVRISEKAIGKNKVVIETAIKNINAVLKG